MYILSNTYTTTCITVKCNVKVIVYTLILDLTHFQLNVSVFFAIANILISRLSYNGFQHKQK